MDIKRNLSPSKIQKMKAHEEKVLKYQTLERNVLQTLQDFLIAALTMICRERKLTPNHKDIFNSTFKFGINIPVFANTQARLYVEGIAKKAVALIRQNALHACIFHVKEARLYCHQRFVFTVEGEWSISECKNREPSSIMLRLENHCHNCLLKIISIQSDLKDLRYPTVSRWSISLGLREEFISILKENDILNPFQNDPDSHFPWKRTVRPSTSDNMVKTSDCISSEGNGYHHNQPTNATNVTNNDHDGNTSTPAKEDEIDSSVTSTDGVVETNLKYSLDTFKSGKDDCINRDPQKSADEDGKDSEIMMDLDDILDSDSDPLPQAGDSSSWNEEEEDEESSVFLVPIHSFKILEGLVFNVYALDYSEIVEKQIKLMGVEQFLASTKGS